VEGTAKLWAKPTNSTYFSHAATSISNCVLGLLCTSRAPGTTRSRHSCVSEEIYFAVSKIRGFPSLRDRFERERTEVFRESWRNDQKHSQYRPSHLE
jgi:hypothetical protein